MPNDIYILGGARTPMADYTGKLKDFSALELGAIAARAAMERTGVKPETVDHVVFGNVLQTSADAVYGARHVGLKAGVPDRGAGADGQPPVRVRASRRRSAAAQMILLGEADIVLTGGTESMSQAPHVIRGLRSGLRLGQGQLEDTLWSALLDTHCGCTMAATAENCAAKYGITRDEQDRYAIRSQQLADARLDRRAASTKKSSRSRSRPARASRSSPQDDHMRPDSTLEGLAKLPAAFSKDGCVTAGNASGIVDGAAALLLASARTRCQDARPDAARAADPLGDRRRRAVADGHGAGARHAQGARAGRTHAEGPRSRSRSTKRSRRSTWRSRRSSASIATASTSTAARSRSAIRSA